MPSSRRAASSPDLENAFTSHLEVTKGHVERLEQIFGMLDLPVRGKKCKGMEGLLEEGKEILEEAVDLLNETLEEEEAADKKLTELGEGGINEAALSAGQGMESDE